MKSRITVLFIALNLIAVFILIRAASLQIWPSEKIKNLQRRQFQTLIELHGRRGDITDRKGHEMAVSAPAYSLFADPKMIMNRKKVAVILQKELGLTKKQVLEKFKNKSRFVWIARKLDRPKHDQIEALKIKGLGFIEESVRIYPNEKLLAQSLGIVGSEAKGLEGIELMYNDILSGQSKTVSMKRDARGRPLIVNGQIFNEAPDGSDLQLTIDRELQFILEQELTGVVSEQRADSAVGVVLDANTSEVLALAGVPGGVEAGMRRNRAVSDSFEPGSVMKPILIAGVLQKKLMTPETRIDCEGGKFKIGDKVIHEADEKHDFKMMTISEILAFSSNVGAAKIGLKFGDENSRQNLMQFGFGEKTNIDLPGEAKGILQPIPWRPHLLANISFGHGVGVTPIQIANAYAAIANGGWLKRPFLVKKIHDNETGESVETQVKTFRRVLTQDVADQMKMMLVGTTSKEGTGFNARVPGFLVAGKTGTAQKVNPNGRGYLKNSYISSFAGFLPANDPKFVIYISVDNPRKDFYGSQVAAPVFSKVARFAVRQFGLAPVYASETTFISEKKLSPAVGIARAIKAASLLPHVHLESEVKAPLNLVPDFKGLTLKEVMTRMNNGDIDFRTSGNGLVAATVPAAGSEWPNEKDKKLEIKFAPDSSHGEE
jgi:cell division protein FtsI (penicillin-binding protein 3)